MFFIKSLFTIIIIYSKLTTSSLDKVEFFIIPESNPDGARLTFFDEGRRMWRKNLRPPVVGSNCSGVDCNRNFPRYWGEAGSSSIACSETYRGPSPLSEPETRSIAEFVSKQRNIIFAIDSHSYGQAIFRPSINGGQFITSEPVSDQDNIIYLHLENQMNQMIETVQGLSYSVGSTSNHAGTTDEYLFFDHRIFAFDLECGNDFQPPIDQAILAALEVAEATKALGLCASGETGLDINNLLAQRPTVTVDELNSKKIDFVEEPWQVDSLSQDKWRRFLLNCTPLQQTSFDTEYDKLADLGFDVDFSDNKSYFEIIASANDLIVLLQLGYRPVVIQDMLSELKDYG